MRHHPETPAVILLQDELIRGSTPPVPVPGRRVISFSGHSPEWRGLLRAYEGEFAFARTRVGAFVSLQVAAFLRRECPWIGARLMGDEPALRASWCAGVLPGDLLLSSDPLWLPFGALRGAQDRLEKLFGPRLFVRPDSADKLFAGCDFLTSELPLMIATWNAAGFVPPETLVMVAAAADIRPVEWRFWLCGERVVTWAPYRHHGGFERLPEPAEELMALARSVAALVVCGADPVVADFAELREGGFRLIELNGFSTSGIYEGADFGALFVAVDEILM